MGRKLLSSTESSTDTLASTSVTVQCSLGRKLGAVGTGLVYEVISSPESGSDQDSESSIFPPLVAKIASRTRNKRIAREAWFYDEMRTLQGVVIPRCFG